jgi:hypothetical protein
MNFILLEAIVIVKPTEIEFSETLNSALERLSYQTGRSSLELIQEAVEIYLSQQNFPLPPFNWYGSQQQKRPIPTR